AVGMMRRSDKEGPMKQTRNKPNQQIVDEAAEWFVDFREGELDAAGQKAFSQWLRRSPEHITAYMEVAAFWADVPNIAVKEDIDVPALIAYARAEDNIVSLAAVGRAHGTATGGSDAVARTETPTERAIPVRVSLRSGLLAAAFAMAVAGLA